MSKLKKELAIIMKRVRPKKVYGGMLQSGMSYRFQHGEDENVDIDDLVENDIPADDPPADDPPDDDNKPDLSEKERGMLTDLQRERERRIAAEARLAEAQQHRSHPQTPNQQPEKTDPLSGIKPEEGEGYDPEAEVTQGQLYELLTKFQNGILTTLEKRELVKAEQNLVQQQQEDARRLRIKRNVRNTALGLDADTVVGAAADYMKLYDPARFEQLRRSTNIASELYTYGINNVPEIKEKATIARNKKLARKLDDSDDMPPGGGNHRGGPSEQEAQLIDRILAGDIKNAEISKLYGIDLGDDDF